MARLRWSGGPRTPSCTPWRRRPEALVSGAILRPPCHTDAMTESTTEPTLTDRQRLAALRRAFHALEPRVVAGEPWPLAEAFGVEPEASWGPREVLAHVAEMLPFWLGELDRILLGSGLVPFGRGQDDPMR